MQIAHKAITVDGVEVLFIKWQDDDENPTIKMMAYVGGIFAESDISFDDDERRDKCWDEKAEYAATDFVGLAKSASPQ